MKSFFFAVMFVTSFSGICFAQSTEQSDSVANKSRNVRFSVGGGYLLGGQIYNESFSYNPGFSADVSAYYGLNETIFVGGGAGIAALVQKEQFVPLYLSFLGFTRAEKSGTYFLLNAGASVGSGDAYEALERFELNGGPFFKAGIGRRFVINNFAFLMGVAFQHQWARGTFESAFGSSYSEPFNYDYLAFELRLFY
jgi:hypothetical protein